MGRSGLRWLARALAVVVLGLLAGAARGQGLRGTPGAGDASVDSFLAAFERASVGNDANVKAELYAERVDRYFLRTRVTREFIYRDLLAWLGGGRLITSFRLTPISETSGQGGERTLLVRKDASWINGGEKRVLSTRSQFILRRFGGEWKIVSERDYRPDRR